MDHAHPIRPASPADPHADAHADSRARLTVVGVGGGGGNAVNRMVAAGVPGVRFVAVNADRQALAASAAHHTVQIGQRLTRGLGAGARPELGRDAAEENAEDVAASVAGADLVFVTCGMGGGTGTGASPTVARLARESGALVVGVVTRPFLFEGRVRARNADAGIDALAAHVDTMVVVSNERLIAVVGANLTFVEALRRADEVLLRAVQSVASVVGATGVINVDFADVRTVMQGGGAGVIGLGEACGADRAANAALQATASPLLDGVTMAGARAVLINVAGGADLTLGEVHAVSERVHDAADPDADIIFGTVHDPALGDTIRVTVIATGFPMPAHVVPPAPPAPVSRAVAAGGRVTPIAVPVAAPVAAPLAAAARRSR